MKKYTKDAPSGANIKKKKKKKKAAMLCYVKLTLRVYYLLEFRLAHFYLIVSGINSCIFTLKWLFGTSKILEK